ELLDDGKKGIKRKREPRRRAAQRDDRRPDKYKLRRQEGERRAVEERIEALEERIASVEAGLIKASAEKDAPRIASLGAEYERLRRDLSEAYAAWETLTEDKG
ncbi:hypothetical protein DRJ12_04095, partial [Candidatus Acetothermia bacterium]